MGTYAVLEQVAQQRIYSSAMRAQRVIVERTIIPRAIRLVQIVRGSRDRGIVSASRLRKKDLKFYVIDYDVIRPVGPWWLLCNAHY